MAKNWGAFSDAKLVTLMVHGGTEPCSFLALEAGAPGSAVMRGGQVQGQPSISRGTETGSSHPRAGRVAADSSPGTYLKPLSDMEARLLGVKNCKDCETH